MQITSTKKGVLRYGERVVGRGMGSLSPAETMPLAWHTFDFAGDGFSTWHSSFRLLSILDQMFVQRTGTMIEKIIYFQSQRDFKRDQLSREQTVPRCAPAGRGSKDSSRVLGQRTTCPKPATCKSSNCK